MSQDKVSARGCNSKVVEKHHPTYNFLFATNNPIQFVEKPKNSERDRLLILWLPNKFVGEGDPVTSPRTFRKDHKIEDKALGEDFALGILIILVQRR